MDKINLQQKARTCVGEISNFWFENSNIGLQRTLFYKIVVPLEPFDSGLCYVQQPEETEIVIDWIVLDSPSIESIESFEIGSDSSVSYESTIYIGSAHNPIDYERLLFKRISANEFFVQGRALIDFKHERVAENEYFDFSAKLKINVAA